jgi:hypothetical protein
MKFKHLLILEGEKTSVHENTKSRKKGIIKEGNIRKEKG